MNKHKIDQPGLIKYIRNQENEWRVYASCSKSEKRFEYNLDRYYAVYVKGKRVYFGNKSHEAVAAYNHHG